jgi:hypothetical protein
VTTEALAARWAYAQDDPFPVFAEVRELGAVHQVRLADGPHIYCTCGEPS